MPDTKTLDRQLAQWVPQQRERLTQDLIRAVSIRSVAEPQGGEHPFGRGCADALDYMLALSREYGFTAENHGYYCGSCLLSGAGGSRTIGIFGHLDVVPEGTSWQKDPYRAWLREDYLIGRGVSDNKGPAVAALHALRFLKEHGIALRSNVRLVYGCAEEIGMQDMDYFAATQPMPDFSLVPDSAFPVCYGEKGHIQLRAAAPVAGGNLLDFSAGEAFNIVASRARAVLKDVTPAQAERALGGVEGVSAEPLEEGKLLVTATGMGKHSAFPEGSVDAVGRLARALAGSGLARGPAKDALGFLGEMTADYYGEGLDIPFEDADSGKLTHVFSLAECRDGQLVVGCDIRYPISADGSQVRDRLTRRLSSGGFSLIECSDDPPAYVSPQEHGLIIQTLCEIVNGELGTALEPFTMGGGTYARKLKNAVGFGPGRRDQAKPFPDGQGGAHQPNEAVSLPALLDMIPIYVKALIAIDDYLAENSPGE